MELAVLAIESLRAESLIEPVGWVRGFPKEDHRSDPTFSEPTRHIAQEKTTNAVTMLSPQYINLVQFTLETRNSTVMWCPLRKTNQLASIICHDETKPTLIVDRKGLLPLTLPEFVRRAA